MVAVSSDDAAATARNIQQLELTYPVLSDPGLRGVDAYAVRHVDEPQGKQIPRPAAFIVDVNGIVRFTYVGENPRDRPSEDQLLEVLANLNAQPLAKEE